MSFDLESFDLPTFDPIPRRRAAAPVAKAKPVKKLTTPVARVPESVPVATAAEGEVEKLQSELAVLRAELAALRADVTAIREAPAEEARRAALAAVWLADRAYHGTGAEGGVSAA